MNILFLSEHYSPKVGGTVSYLLNTLKSLPGEDRKISLLIPIQAKVGSLKTDVETIPGVHIFGIGVGEDELKFDAKERSILCDWVKANLIDFCKEHEIEVFHLLFGLFLAEVIDTDSLRKENIKSIHTIHNIPPQECSRTWEGDSLKNRLLEKLRNVGVYYLNKKRICKRNFDFYITPSQVVKDLLSKWIPESKIHVIPHGGAEFIETREALGSNEKTIKILTAGGIVPHKNQHLIPGLTKALIERAHSIEWNIVGPFRNSRYVSFINNEIEKNGLESQVKLFNQVPKQTLIELYQGSDIYIQLSTEEGFCMTVLDAISYGLPVLAHPAGAIPEMLSQVDGTLIDIMDQEYLAKTIHHYLTIRDSIQSDSEKLKDFKSYYTWKNSAKKLIELYHE